MADLFAVSLAGEYAKGALESGSSWRMLAAFSKGFYCQNQLGQLVFLGSASIGAGPLNVLCEMPERRDWQAEGFDTDTTVCFDGKVLSVDGRFGFAFENARLWRAAALPEKWDRQLMAERLVRLSEEVGARRPSGGLAGLIPRFTELRLQASSASDPLLRSAWPGIQALHRWLKNGLAAEAWDGASDALEIQGLIGLGPGLTPSGDDLLGGCMIALHAFGQARIAQALGQVVLALASTRTNAISMAHLDCAAEGQGAKALHDAIVALCSGSDSGFMHCLDEIGSIGASSGWDAVAGVFLAMQALLETNAAGKRSLLENV
jgi:hypothetical protein